MMLSSPTYVLPPVKRALRRLVLTFGAVVLLIAGVFAYFYIDSRISPQHFVIIENGQTFAVDVEIGNDKLSLRAGEHTYLRAHDGKLTAHARGPNGFTDTATLELPETGFNTVGRTALYNIGGASELAVATVTYGSTTGKAPPVQIIERGTRVTLLPRGTNASIDEAFPEMIKTKFGGVTMIHVCHANVEAQHLDCPGF